MAAAAQRLESLDVFRGVTIAAMILVNNPGDWSVVFPPLQHAYWTGLNGADLVFPWFLFIMGAAMPLAFARRHARGQPLAQLYVRIARRVVVLMLVGLALNAVADWPGIGPLRIPGVLQRLAWSYLIAAPIVLHFEVRGWIGAAVVLLLAHWALLRLVPFDGFPGGTMTPEHNLARHLDLLVFGRHSLAIPIDPEGLLGTLSSAATVLGGAAVGRMMPVEGDRLVPLGRLAIAGAAAIVLGTIWALVLPLSKPLWTGSFVLLVSGLATVVLTAAYLVVDVLGLRRWALPFRWLGANPLLIYAASELVGHLLDQWPILRAGESTTPKAWLFWSGLEPALRPRSPQLASLLFGGAYVLMWIAVAGLLSRRQIRLQA